MPNRIDLDKQELYDYYINKNKTKIEAAKHFGVHVDTITRNLIQYNIPRHEHNDWAMAKEFELSKYQRDIITGALLGDGCMALFKHARNACFTYTSKSAEHVKFVCSSLFEFSTKAQKWREASVFDKRTYKTYTRIVFRTANNIAFTKIYNQWYPEGKKIIPENVVLNPTICLIWYLGDGTLCHSKRSAAIYLCTDCFEKEQIEKILIPQLSMFEATLKEHDKNKWRIYIPRRKIKAFLDYIGPCPFKDYAHKWDYTDYKNTFVIYNPEIEQNILRFFSDGISPGTIAKYYKIDRTTVLNCLKRYSQDISKNKFNKKKVVINNDERQLGRSHERL